MLVLTMHVVAALVCVHLPLVLLNRLVLLLGVIGSLMWNSVIYRRRTPLRISWSQEQGWHLTTRDGRELDVELTPEIHLGSWLIILKFRESSGRLHTVLLAQDSTHPRGLRRLRMLLRFGPPKA